MRSSKSRSRNKSNRNRSVGNIVNRVFDSSGPEGKVRGTPQQIIDKYNQLARDAQLSNDRVATENFQQHAEHYLRMLSEAQREQQERQAQFQQNQQQNQQNQHQNQQRNNAAQGSDEQPNVSDGAKSDGQKKAPDEIIDADSPQPDIGLVETPENRPQRQRRQRRKPEPQVEAQTEAPAEKPAAETPIAESSETPTTQPDAAE